LTLLLVACGVPCGLAVRRRLTSVLPLLVRGQMLALSMPLAFAAGLLFVPRFNAVVSMAGLIAAEAAGIWIGGLLNARSGRSLVAVTASSSNTGIWALPVAGMLFGPAAVAFVAVFDQMSLPRGLVLTSRLRRFAPTKQVSRSALVDYAPAAALATGLLLQALFGRPHGLGPWLPRFGVAAAVANMILIGAAVPSARPAITHARKALLGALFRFVPGVAMLTLLLLVGIHPPAAAWLLAFAPSYYTMLTLSRLYGYDGREAVATALTTTALAAAALPLLVVALR
jgi:predicted permease